jgi:hypothetical protein
MTRTTATREVWYPQTQQDREIVLLELQAVLASPHFSNSKRYPALLRYVIENTLAGKSDLLKERTLGVDVFERPLDYDTNADPVVRYTAGEVRKRLSLFYHDLDRRPAVQISLPSGSYVPQFTHEHEEQEDNLDSAQSSLPSTAGVHSDWVSSRGHREWPGSADAVSVPHSAADLALASAPRSVNWVARKGLGWIAAALIIAMLSGLTLRNHTTPPYTPIDDFWAPILRNQKTVLICAGVVVFNPSAFSGVTTAGKDAEYPFVSFQGASSIALLSVLVAKNGVSTQLQPSASIPLTALRAQPVIYVGGYNNQWTLRLLDPLPFHFAPEADAAILDRDHPQIRWARNRSQPYSGADDYGLIARFRDTNTGQWVIVVAGLGRNGAEAAADFVTSPQYMQLLHDRMRGDFATRSVEVVLKVNVIDGKTGAPSISALQVW